MSLEIISAGKSRSVPGHALVRVLRVLAVRFRFATDVVPERQGAFGIPPRAISQSELNDHLRRDIGLPHSSDGSLWQALR